MIMSTYYLYLYLNGGIIVDTSNKGTTMTHMIIKTVEGDEVVVDSQDYERANKLVWHKYKNCAYVRASTSYCLYFLLIY